MPALEQVLPLFRPSAFSHIEIMMLVWPQSKTAMWSDILEQQVVLGTCIAQPLRFPRSMLTAFARPFRDADAAAAVKAAIVEFRADIVFFLIGSVDADSQVATSLQDVLRESPVPVSVLHASARAAR